MILAPNKKDLEVLQKLPHPAEKEFWGGLDGAALMQKFIRASVAMFSNIEAKWEQEERNRSAATESLGCDAVLFETSQADFLKACDRPEQYNFATSNDLGLWRSIRVAGLWLQHQPQPPPVFELKEGKLVKKDGLHRIAIALCGDSRLFLYAPEQAGEFVGFSRI